VELFFNFTEFFASVEMFFTLHFFTYVEMFFSSTDLFASVELFFTFTFFTSVELFFTCTVFFYLCGAVFHVCIFLLMWSSCFSFLHF
jgi:hypothetical protein